jgi:chromosome segregation ATPase
MNVNEATKYKSDVDRNLAAWRSRSDELRQQRDGAGARRRDTVGRLGAAIAAIDPDDKAIASLRRQRAAAETEAEELEAALVAALEKVAALEAESEAAGRRLQAAQALELVSAVQKAATAVDAALIPLLPAIEKFVRLHDETVAAVRAMRPNEEYRIVPHTISAVLLWRVNALVEVTPVQRMYFDPDYRRSLADYLTDRWRLLPDWLAATASEPAAEVRG